MVKVRLVSKETEDKDNSTRIHLKTSSSKMKPDSRLGVKREMADSEAPIIKIDKIKMKKLIRMLKIKSKRNNQLPRKLRCNKLKNASFAWQLQGTPL